MAEINVTVDRIDRAIERIEAAIDSRASANAALQRRHEMLKARMGEAIATLDDLIARGAQT